MDKNDDWSMSTLGKMAEIQKTTMDILKDMRNDCIAKGVAFDESSIDKFYDYYEKR